MVIAKKLWPAVAGIPLTLAACGGDNLTLPSEGRPAHIEVVSTDLQGQVNSELKDQLIVRVTDSKQDPVQGATVTFVLEEDAGGGSVTPATGTTDNDGLATASVVLGTQAGQMTGRAEVPVEEGTVPVTTGFTVTVLSTDASRISMVSGDLQSAPVNTVLIHPLVVQVSDGFGNRIPGITVQWTVEGGGSVSAASTVTDDSGRTSVTRTLGGTAGEQTTQASADLAGSPVTFTHISTAGNAARVNVVSGNGQQGAPGSTLPADLVVEVLDENNNPIVKRAVAWVVGTGEGSANPEMSETDAQGRASTKWTLGPQPGRNTLTAVVSGVGLAAFSAMGAKTASSTSITSHQPEPSSVGQGVEVRVQVTGSSGAPTGGVNVTGDNAAPCTITLADGAGSCILTFQAAGNHRITATYTGDGQFNGSSDSKNHRVDAPNAAPTAAFTPPNCTAGQPCQFNDASGDSDGNVVAWTWELGDGSTLNEQHPSHTYTAPGSYNVKLTVRDDDNATNEVTHSITVTQPEPINFPPVASDDSYGTSVGTPLHAPGGIYLGLLANDADLDGDPLSATPGAFPTTGGGTVTIASDGSFDYAPAPAFSGVDTFDYTVSDARGGSDTGTAFVNVQ